MAETYVLDTNVLLRAFLPSREYGDIARRVLALLLAGDIIAVAPRNLLYEFCGAVSKVFRQRAQPLDAALRVIRAFQRLPIRYVEMEPLLERALALSFACNKAFYDTCFFAVSEGEQAALCTADDRLIRGLGPDFPCRIILLREFFQRG